MEKEFLAYNSVRNNSIKLAHTIRKSGFIPDVIYVSLRGGAYIGNLLSEYFKTLREGGRPVLYAAVVARSYTDIRQQDRVMVDGWTYNPEFLRNGDRVLLVDDIFDSGKTINHLAQIIMDKGIPREDLKIAVHDFKYFPDKEQLPVQPDYFCRKHVIKAQEEDRWIHYLSHELVGLTQDECEIYYFSEDQELREAFSVFLDK